MASEKKPRYQCKGCGVDVFLDVRDRQEGEDIVNYVNYLARMASEDHGARSPKCRAESCDLLIPTSDDQAGAGQTGEERR